MTATAASMVSSMVLWRCASSRTCHTVAYACARTMGAPATAAAAAATTATVAAPCRHGHEAHTCAYSGAYARARACPHSTRHACVSPPVPGRHESAQRARSHPPGRRPTGQRQGKPSRWPASSLVLVAAAAPTATRREHRRECTTSRRARLERAIDREITVPGREKRARARAFASFPAPNSRRLSLSLSLCLCVCVRVCVFA